MTKTFYIEYTDQFGNSDELEVEASIIIKDIYEYDRRGNDYKVGEEYYLDKVEKISDTHLQLTEDDKKEIEGLIFGRVEKLNGY